MRFIKDLAATHRQHKLLLATNPTDKESVNKAHSEFFYLIGHLISDIGHETKRESGPRRKQWKEIRQSLNELCKEGSFVSRNDSPMARLMGVDDEYAALDSKIRELEGY